MPVQDLLAHLEKVRRTGNGTWSARCPAHDDKGPSLAIRELDDGRVLLHCFAGCPVGNVVSAVGMTMEDLFPPRPIENSPGIRKPYFPATAVLESLAKEATIVLMVANAIRNGRATVPEDDMKRLVTAVGRIQSGLDTVKNPDR